MFIFAGDSGGGTVGSNGSIYSTLLAFDVSGNLIYFGLAVPGSSPASAVWQIRKLDYSGAGNVIDVLFANGSLLFNSVWNDRATYPYS
jgi:hypothetical protein